MSVFTYVPEFGASCEKNPAVTPIKFGDGYEARNRFGMNTNRQSWSLTFANRDASEATAIDNFLSARGGYEAFEWTPPGEASSLVFVCRRWTKSPQKANLFTIQATFEQVYEPA